ncbi:radical SAM/SPASM domain-containing protein [Candidatus Pelagibacter sp.]|uniref:radical SAM/SPASM domain-containing protein n=1 Tax=Candidatus Pelagibacter sp. TaxID=2024849 RepID=UPI003F86BAB0
MENKKSYSTDGKVKHLSTEEDINIKLGKIIGQKFIDYRKTWDAANNFEIVTDFPLFLHVDMNQTCNYKCPHCIIAYKDEVEGYYEGKNLNFEDYKKIVDEGSDYNCPSISPQGNNEPFLIKDLHKYINYAYKKGFIDIMLNNNGSAITPKRAQQVLDSGLTRIRFSLDALSAESYPKVRVGAIPLEKVKKNIETFLNLKEQGNYKLPVTGVSFVKMKHNEHELDDFINYWRDRVDMVSIQTFTPPTTNVEKYEKFYASDQLIESEPISEFKCVQPFQRVVICNETIYPCCVNFNKDLSIGKLGQDTIYSAWHSKKMNDLRNLHRQGKFYLDKTCTECVNLIYPNNTISKPI